MSAKQPLEVTVSNKVLRISIGVDILASAFDFSEFAKQFSSDLGEEVQLFKVEDPVAFAKDVKNELEREEEDGTTPVHKLLDAACEAAVENGSEAVLEHPDLNLVKP